MIWSRMAGNRLAAGHCIEAEVDGQQVENHSPSRNGSREEVLGVALMVM